MKLYTLKVVATANNYQLIGDKIKSEGKKFNIKTKIGSEEFITTWDYSYFQCQILLYDDPSDKAWVKNLLLDVEQVTGIEIKFKLEESI